MHRLYCSGKDSCVIVKTEYEFAKDVIADLEETIQEFYACSPPCQAKDLPTSNGRSTGRKLRMGDSQPYNRNFTDIKITHWKQETLQYGPQDKYADFAIAPGNFPKDTIAMNFNTYVDAAGKHATPDRQRSDAKRDSFLQYLKSKGERVRGI